MTRDEAAIERMARAIYARADVQVRENGGIDADGLLPWEDPGCGRETAREQARDAFAALLSDPPPAVERAVLERLLTELDEMRQHYRGNSYLAERAQWTADWLREKRAALAQGESDGKSD